MPLGNEPFSVKGFRYAAYADITLGTLGSWVAAPKYKTFTVNATLSEIRNTYNGGPGSAVNVVTGGTLTGTLAGVPIEFIAAVCGLTVVTTGTTPNVVKTLDFPMNSAPPLGVAEVLQDLGDGGQQIIRIEGIRFPPLLTLGATEQQWSNSEFSATVSGNTNINRLARIVQSEQRSGFPA